MLAWLGLHFAIGSLGTWLARRYALHRDLIDLPGERRSHNVPTPRGGGVAIVIALLVAVCVLGWRQPAHIVLLGAFALGLILVAGIGLVDDHRPLSPWLRLAVHAVASAVLALGVAGTWSRRPFPGRPLQQCSTKWITPLDGSGPQGQNALGEEDFRQGHQPTRRVRPPSATP